MQKTTKMALIEQLQEHMSSSFKKDFISICTEYLGTKCWKTGALPSQPQLALSLSHTHTQKDSKGFLRVGFFGVFFVWLGFFGGWGQAGTGKEVQGEYTLLLDSADPREQGNELGVPPRGGTMLRTGFCRFGAGEINQIEYHTVVYHCSPFSQKKEEKKWPCADKMNHNLKMGKKKTKRQPTQ